MCIFSGMVREVSTTRIFARLDGGGRQILVYSMTVTLDRELAMVLPLPVVPDSGDAAVSFIDLSGYAGFFDDVALGFPVPQGGGVTFALTLGAPQRAPLVVHDIGAFVASYVPSPADLDRLDPRFRIPQAVFANQAYDDWGFAVFQLKPHAAPPPRRRWFRKAQPPGDQAIGPQKIHPMAFTFPTRRPRAVFFPTLHVHDGATVPATARFAHTLVCQSDDEALARSLGWRRSLDRLGAHVNADRARGVIDPDAFAYQHQMHGYLPNADHWFEAPR